MKRAATIAILLFSACGTAHERAVEDALHAGNAFYLADDLESALEAYRASPEDHRTSFNAGLVLHRTDRAAEAVERYTVASNLADSAMDRARALYNLGHLWNERATLSDSTAALAGEQARSIKLEGDINEQVRLVVLRDSLFTLERDLIHFTDSALTQSRSAYQQTLRWSPTDEDARHNLTLVLKRIASRPTMDTEKGGTEKQDDQKLGAKALLIMERADQLVEKYLFQDALDLMRQGIQQDPTLQQRKDYMDKLDMITKAARP